MTPKVYLAVPKCTESWVIYHQKLNCSIQPSSQPIPQYCLYINCYSLSTASSIYKVECTCVQVMERAMMHCGNAYYFPNIVVYGSLCKTNLVTNTAFRGFGAPQGMFVAEYIMRHVASYLKKDPFEVSVLICNDKNIILLLNCTKYLNI